MALRHIQDQSVIYSATTPSTNRIGQLWFDTSTIPGSLNECISLSPVTYQLITVGGGGGGAPTGAQYLVGALDAGLTNERLVVDTLTISWGLSTPGQVTATVIDDSVTNAKLAEMPTLTIKGNNSGVSANPLDLTAAQVKTLLAIVAGDVSGLATIASSGSANDLSAGTVPAGRMPALTGDVTSSSGSVATTIAPDVVTFPKMQNISTQRLLGRGTAGLGDVEEITLGAGLAFSGTSIVATGGAAAQVSPVVLLDMAESGEDGMPGIPGADGLAGSAGEAGADGRPGGIIFLEPDVPDDPMVIPGPQGLQGVPGGGGGGGGLTEVLPVLPYRVGSSTVVVSDAAVTATSKILIGWGNVLDTDVNDPEMDDVTFSARSATGSYTLRVSSTNPRAMIGGPFRIAYMVAA